MTICGGQRDAPRDTILKTTFLRDAGPSTALAGYAPVLGGLASIGNPRGGAGRQQPNTIAAPQQTRPATPAPHWPSKDGGDSLAINHATGDRPAMMTNTVQTGMRAARGITTY